MDHQLSSVANKSKSRSFLGVRKELIIGLTPLTIVAISAIIEFLFISSNSIAGDEPFSIYHSQMRISSIIDLCMNGNNPPLHFIMLHYWIKLFGISPLSVRFLSVVFSVTTVYFVYRIGKDFFSYQTGVLSSLLFSFSNLNLLLSHEARVYTLFGLLATLSMFFFLSIRKNKNRYFYIFLLITNTLLVYSHYLGIFVIIVQTIAVLLIKDIRKPLFKYYMIYLLLFSCFFIPNIILLLNRFSGTPVGTWLDQPNGIISIYDMLWTFSNKPVTTVFCLLILVAALVKYLITKQKTGNVTNNKIILLWFLFPFFTMFFVSYWLPMFLDRYLYFVSIGYYFTLAIAISFIFQADKFNYLFSGIFLILFVVTFNPKMDNKRHAEETVAKVTELKDQNTSVIICPSFFMLNFAYYYNKDFFCEADNGNLYQKLTKRLNDDKVYPINSADLIQYSTKRIVFLDAAANFSFPDNNIYNTLKERYKLKNEYKFYEKFIVSVFEDQ